MNSHHSGTFSRSEMRLIHMKQVDQQSGQRPIKYNGYLVCALKKAGARMPEFQWSKSYSKRKAWSEDR